MPVAAANQQAPTVGEPLHRPNISPGPALTVVAHNRAARVVVLTHHTRTQVSGAAVWIQCAQRQTQVALANSWYFSLHDGGRTRSA